MIISNARLAADLRRLPRKRTALFLGAGASNTFGYPITSELLRRIINALRLKQFLPGLLGEPPGAAKRHRKSLRTYLDQLLPGKARSHGHLPLVTSLLSLIDYSLVTGQSIMAGRSIEETREARRLLERAILEVLAEGDQLIIEEWKVFERFCGFMTHLRGGAGSGLAVITTNYDMASDFAAFKCAGVPKSRFGRWDEGQIGRRVDFGFNWYHPELPAETIMRRPDRPMVTLLKLHGSTNWLRCPLCDHIYINPWGPIWEQAYKGQTDDLNSCHCSPTRLQAQILSPSYVRDMREPNLVSVWNSALNELRAADRWIIVGYSFPDEDLAVRALFTRAYGSRNRTPEIVVVQRDKQAYVRYRAFFDAKSLKYTKGGLGHLLERWTVTSVAEHRQRAARVPKAAERLR